MVEAHYLSLPDILVIAGVLILLVWVGWRASRSLHSQSDFILGGKSLPGGLVGLSLFATLFSTLSYLAYPGEMIKYGLVFCAGMLSFPIAGWVVNRFIIPRITAQNVSSAYEILEMRLGPGSRRLASVYFLLLRYFWMATIVYATVHAAVVPLTGLPEAWVPWVCLLMVGITVLYSTMGGIKAVVWTDAIQSCLMFLGVILTIAIVLSKLGLSALVPPEEVRANWLPWDFTPRLNVRMTVANIFCMNLCWQIFTAGSDQMSVQRYLSVRDARTAARSFRISLLSSAVVQLLLAVAGLMAVAWFSHFPEQLPEGTDLLAEADTLFPRFILVGLPQGVSGLIVAAILAAAMSSLSSGLNSSAVVVQEDFLKKSRRYAGRPSSVRDIRRISLIIGLIVGLSCSLVGYVQGNLLDVIIKLVNLVVAPLFVLFFMALFVPGATDKGTIAGALLSLAVAVAIAIFGVFGITAIWVMPLSFVTGALGACAFSFLTRRK